MTAMFSRRDALARLAALAASAGLPEVSVPAGRGADGLPALNVSITSLPGADARVLALAHACERQSRRFAPPPRP